MRKRNKGLQDKDFNTLIDVNKKLGDLYFDRKMHEEALESYRNQLKAAEAKHDKLNSAIAHRMIGEVYADIGDYDAALKHQNLYLGTFLL